MDPITLPEVGTDRAPRRDHPAVRDRGVPTTLAAVSGNTQRLDGGAMFGNAPRAVWSRWIAPDERHRIALACRAMLVTEDTGRRVLFEAGIGVFGALVTFSGTTRTSMPEKRVSVAGA